ncbi:MAG: hypothetical protein HYS65_05720 [Betaproteobacteria bacterium]|nr:hypothetical protein [Betaproteobacteria bacterium]MBI2226264.1 hypothetical protein [Betaproteobacteria bacterium]MBI2292437.1 hypothetical protein [Betaproteobacteria bacterium]
MSVKVAHESKLDVFSLALKAGLEKAVNEFPDDVTAAAQAAAQARGFLLAPDDPAAEPWPPMRVRTSS